MKQRKDSLDPSPQRIFSRPLQSIFDGFKTRRQKTESWASRSEEEYPLFENKKLQPSYFKIHQKFIKLKEATQQASAKSIVKSIKPKKSRKKETSPIATKSAQKIVKKKKITISPSSKITKKPNDFTFKPLINERSRKIASLQKDRRSLIFSPKKDKPSEQLQRLRIMNERLYRLKQMVI